MVLAPLATLVPHTFYHRMYSIWHVRPSANKHNYFGRDVDGTEAR